MATNICLKNQNKNYQAQHHLKKRGDTDSFLSFWKFDSYFSHPSHPNLLLAIQPKESLLLDELISFL